MISIKSIPVTIKSNKELVLEKMKQLKYTFNNHLSFFIYVNIILYFLYFVKKIFF
jgi:hypothetical protein